MAWTDGFTVRSGDDQADNQAQPASQGWASGFTVRGDDRDQAEANAPDHVMRRVRETGADRLPAGAAAESGNNDPIGWSDSQGNAVPMQSRGGAGFSISQALNDAVPAGAGEGRTWENRRSRWDDPQVSSTDGHGTWLDQLSGGDGSWRQRVGGEELEDSTVKGWVDALSYAGVNGVASILGTAGTIAGLTPRPIGVGDMDNILNRASEGLRQFARNNIKPAELERREGRRAEALSTAEGWREEFAVTAAETASDPMLMATFLTEQVPNLLATGLVGRGAGLAATRLGAGARTSAAAATAGAVGTGAVMQGADAAGGAYEQLMAQEDDLWLANEAYQRLVEQGMEDQEARETVAIELARLAGLKSAAVSLGVNLLPGARTLDRVLAGSVRGSAGRIGDVAIGALRGALGEGASEAIEEGYGVIAGNQAVQQVNPDQDTFEGAGEAAGLALIAAPLGGIAGGVESLAEVDMRTGQSAAPVESGSNWTIESSINQTTDMLGNDGRQAGGWSIFADGQPVNERAQEQQAQKEQQESEQLDEALRREFAWQQAEEQRRQQEDRARNRDFLQAQAEVQMRDPMQYAPDERARNPALADALRAALNPQAEATAAPAETLAAPLPVDSQSTESEADSTAGATAGPPAETQQSPIIERQNEREALFRPVSTDRLPTVKNPETGKSEPMPEPRLKRASFRRGLDMMANELVPGGNVGFVPREGAKPKARGELTGNVFSDYDPTDLIKTPSENPMWFQSIAMDTGVTVKQAQNAVKKALRGQRLGSRQREVVQRMIDHMSAERGYGYDAETGSMEYPGGWRDQIAELKQRKRDLHRIQNGELTDAEIEAMSRDLSDREIRAIGMDRAEEEYADGLEAGDRQLFDLVLEATEVDEAGTRSVLESNLSEEETFDKLNEIRAKANDQRPEVPSEQGQGEGQDGVGQGEGARPAAPEPAADAGGDATVSGEPEAQADLTDPDRRVPPEERARIAAKDVDEMTPEEMRVALLTNEVTGINGRRAFNQAIKSHRGQVVSIDADSLKWVNDNMSPDHGDALLVAVSRTLMAHFGDRESFHISGDEFIVLPSPGQNVDQLMARVAEDLADMELIATKSDGKVLTLKGLNATHGIGPSKEQADSELKAEKRAREQRGERAGRDQEPPGVSRQPAGVPESDGTGGQAGSPDAAAPVQRPQEPAAEAGADSQTEDLAGPTDATAQAQADAERERQRRADQSPDMLEGDGDLFAGPRPEQADLIGPQEVEPIREAQPNQEAPADQEPTAPTEPQQPIEDFGETIAGARKDYAETLETAVEIDMASVPLSKSWPQPNYQKLIDEGSDPKTVALVRALRDEVPAKPRRYVRRWVEDVGKLRDTAIKMLREPDFANKYAAEIKSVLRNSDRMLGRAELYEEFGHDKSLKGIWFTENHYSLYRGEENVTKWVVEQKAKSNAFSNFPRELAVGNTREEALAKFKGVYDSLGSKQRGPIKFGIWSDRSTGDVFIGRKIGKNLIRVHTGFDDAISARKYLNDNQAELESKLEQMRDIPAHRNKSNAPRVGIDHLGGMEATPELWQETFGFRGVQFGNWVEQSRRQDDLNNAYDGLMDLAGVIDVPSKAISLNGELGLAFGARGRGGKNSAAAHYEPDMVVINLTKREGPGSLAHEWWHALDNNFGKRQGRADFMTDGEQRQSGDVRPEVVEAFNGIVRAIRQSGMVGRAKELDGVRSKDYWSTAHELSARAFEAYVIEKLQDQNGANDYLANIVSEKAWEALEGDTFRYPYPTADEMPGIRAAFDNFFQVVETRETDQGVQMYSRGQGGTTREAIVGSLSQRAQKALIDSGLVTVAETPAEWPGEHPGDAAAVYMGGKVYMAASNIQAGNEFGLILHEIGVHRGLKSMLGEKDYGRIVKQIKAQVRRGGRPGAGKAAREAYEAHQRALADDTIRSDSVLWEETIAYMAEAGANSSLFKEIVALIKRALRSMGLARDFTAADVAHLARGSVRRQVAERLDDGAIETTYAPAMYQRQIDQTKTPAFREWFGDSKVVDENGEPLVVYHGGTATDQIGPLGYVTSNREAAEAYASLDQSGKVQSVFVSINNPAEPFDLRRISENLGIDADSVPDYALLRDDMLDGADRIIDEAQSRGYDGAHFPMGEDFSPDGDAIESWVAFSPEQIKSATGNIGTFDPTNPDIRYSRRRQDNAGDGFSFSINPMTGQASQDAVTVDQEAAKPMDKGRVVFGRDSDGKLIELRTKHPYLDVSNADRRWRTKFKRAARRYFVKEGLLTDEAFQRNIQSMGKFESDAIEVESLTSEFGAIASKAAGVKFYMNIPAEKLRDMNGFLGGASPAKWIQESADLFREIQGMRAMLDAKSAETQAMLIDEIRYLIQSQDQQTQKAVLDILSQAQQQDGSIRELTESELEQIEGMAYVGPKIAAKMALVQTIEGNKGTYLNRSYRVFDPGSNWEPSQEVVDKARAFLLKQVEASTEMAGMSDEAKRSRVDGIINGILNTDATDFVSMASGNIGRKDLSILKRRKDIAPEIRDLMGEHQDPKINFARSILKMSQINAKHYFLSKVRQDGLNTENPFLSVRQTAEMSQQIADTDTMAPLAGLWATPDFVQAMERAVDSGGLEGWVKGMVAVNGMVKYGKTVLSPTTAARNFYSAGLFAVANGHVNPAGFKASGKLLLSELMTEFPGLSGLWAFVGRYENARAARAELNQFTKRMAELGVIRDGARSGEIREVLRDVTDLMIEEETTLVRGGKKASGLTQNAVRKFFRIVQKIYQMGDDFWKVLGFANELRTLERYRDTDFAGMSDAELEVEAATRVRDTYPTYSMVPEAVQKLRRAPIGTFVSFPWEVGRTSFNMGKLAAKDIAEGRTRLGMQRATGMFLAASWTYAAVKAMMWMLGIDDEDDEAVRRLGPEWQRDAQLLYLGVDEKGHTTHLDLSHLDPYAYVKQPFNAVLNGSYDGIEDRFGAAAWALLGPFLSPEIGLQAGIEALSGRQMSAGRRDVWNESDVLSDRFIKGLAHFIDVTKPGVFNNVERTMKAIQDRVEPYGRQYELSDELLAWVGFRATTIDPEVSLTFGAYDFSDARSNASRPMNSAIRDVNALTERQIRSAAEDTIEQWERAFQGMFDMVRAARTFGMNDGEIRMALREAGISASHTAWIMRGQVPRWQPSDNVWSQASENVRKEFSRINARDLAQRRIMVRRVLMELQSGDE